MNYRLIAELRKHYPVLKWALYYSPRSAYTKRNRVVRRQKIAQLVNS